MCLYVCINQFTRNVKQRHNDVSQGAAVLAAAVSWNETTGGCLLKGGGVGGGGDRTSAGESDTPIDNSPSYAGKMSHHEMFDSTVPYQASQFTCARLLRGTRHTTRGHHPKCRTG